MFLSGAWLGPWGPLAPNMRAAMGEEGVDDPLCCCEYVNSKGERSHLLALFCDCAEVDDMVDRLVKGLPVPNSRNEEIMATIEDR